jgi:hypothetical protein
MISPLQCAQLSAAIYADDATQWDNRWSAAGVVCGHKRIGDDDVLVFRGTDNAGDWLVDAEAWPCWDRELGFVHAGFLAGMDDVLAAVQETVGGPIEAITGHSLGGARARVAAAKLLVRNQPVRQLVTFGSPKPAFANLARVIQKSQISHLSFRNRNDPVPLVPGLLPQWVHTEQWQAVDSAPGVADLAPLRDHGIAHYVQALTSGAIDSVAPAAVVD